MENRQTNHTPNESKIVQMFRIDPGVRVDLEGVVVVCRIFEQTVKWVKHLMREKEKKLSVYGQSEKAPKSIRGDMW